jgi:hypothetical protein
MTAAFDQALRKLGLKDRTDKATELVARNIIAFAKYGERDATKLCDGVLASLNQRGGPGRIVGFGATNMTAAARGALTRLRSK